jgi:hypothetical protein
MMDVRIECLREPDLEFGRGLSGPEPKRVLKTAGPFDRQESPEIIRLGLVGPASEIGAAKCWLPRLNGMLVSTEGNSRRFRDYPGALRAFSARFELDSRFIRPLDEERFQFALGRRLAKDRFDAMIELYEGRISSLFGDKRPECILVCLPEELATLRIANPSLTDGERRVLEPLQAEEESAQLSLFGATREEELLAAELRPQAEELLFRSFYRALKARTMSDSNPVPIQVLRRHTYVESEANQQSEGTRAWNLASALYYKSGRIPWRPSGLGAGTCFVGTTFHHLRKRGSGIVYASVAQVLANDLEPFALKGESIPPDQRRERQPYLTERQSGELIDRVIETYKHQAGMPPSRLVIHKTSRYDPDEQLGFRDTALKRVPACDLIWLGETSFRLLRKGMQEPWRGTLCSIGSDEHYLFTTGYVPYWDEYPGPHVPAPLQIGSANETDMRERAREILALSKMNWNSAEGIARHPITLSFARKIGTIMTEMGDNPNPNPSYRFYM